MKLLTPEAAPAASPNPAPLADGVVKDLVRLFKLLSDATRLRILHYLMRTEEFHVRKFCELLGQSQPAVSHHLGLLRTAGLIEARREGKHNYYRLRAEGFHQLLDVVFASIPKADRRIRFEEYVLSYSPPK